MAWRVIMSFYYILCVKFFYDKINLLAEILACIDFIDILDIQEELSYIIEQSFLVF